MKIGIITVYDSQNFGAVLQAYGLKTTLEEMGHDVYFIQKRSRKQLYKEFRGKTKNIMKLIFNIKKYNIFKNVINSFNELRYEEVINNNIIDLLVIGSDELWNINNPGFRNNYFYGIGVKAKKKITYAICSGATTYDKFSNYEDYLNAIKSIDTIFVRDKLTELNIGKIIGKNPQFTCDPTFLIDVSKFKKDYINKVKGRYLLIYSYSYSKKQKDYIKAYAKENKLLIVSAGLYCSWADKNVNCSPFEFSDVICNAEAVVTTTFHGTIFSILNKKQFVVFEGREKTKDVLEKTGLLNAMIDENTGYDEFEKQFNISLDFEGAHNRIKKMRKESIEKLKSELTI